MAAYFLTGWITASAAYVLFAGQFSADELVASVLCGLAASLWGSSVRRTAGPRFQFDRGALSATARAIADTPAATTKVAFALLKAIVMGGGGELRRQAFVRGRLQDPEDAGRRAIAVLARSLAPDSFVVRAAEGEASLNLHALVKIREGDPRWAV